MDVKQAIYHRSRDAELSDVGWCAHDIEQMRALSNLGIALSITGGIVPKDIHLFAGIATKAFIAGRALALTGGEEVACALRREIERYW